MQSALESSPAKGKVPLYGIIKEVAPTKQAEDDATLGVGEFETKYFKSGQLYMDEEREFYAYLGNRKLNPLKALLNPFKAYRGFKELGARLKEKEVEGNMVGEGLVLGGVLVVNKDGDVLFSYREETGQAVPVTDIQQALKELA